MRNAMNRSRSLMLAPLWALLLGSSLAGAQDATLAPAPGINRNPAYRDQLPPNPVPPPDSRDTVVPQPGPDDPRDSDTRPVLRPDGRDARDVPAPAPTSTGPTHPAPAAPDNTRR